MGCTQSSEAAVQQSSSPSKPATTTAGNQTQEQATTPIKPSGERKHNGLSSTKGDAATKATIDANSSPDSSVADHGKSTSSTTQGQQPQHSRQSDNQQTAGYSQSYASGASSPNSSTGDISSSWNHDTVNHTTVIQLDDGSTNGSMKSRNRRSNKTIKHSSSAIGLDEMLNDHDGNLTSKVVHIEVPFGRPIEEVYHGVHDGPVLGSGVSGLVRLVEHKATGVKYAVKCLDLGLVGSKEGLSQLREEIYIMTQLDHPNIVRLFEVYESHSEIYLVQELCLGGELFDRLDEQPDYHYTESECARLVKQMLSAVRYLHSKGIIHRDLKLENFLFTSTAGDSELKMIDFGLSKHFRFGEVQHEAVGTPYTVAPEVISGNYDERCDIWAIGVITFLLLSGDPPFGGCGGPEPLMTVRSNILNGAFSFEPQEIWSLVSERAREFIRDTLVTDPKKRPTAREAQRHSWLREWANRARKADDNVLNPNVVKALVAFKEFSDMRKLLSEVLSFTLLPEQIKDLRKEFEKIDTDGSGEISLMALKQVLLANAGAGSLGALTELEVEDVFNAMRVNKSEARIHWHEFVAAGLSQCKVDDRNLRLAFDRLDSSHKGYITIDDIIDLVGDSTLQSTESTQKMWQESMKAVNCTQARITYGDFLRLMKGQESTVHVCADKRQVVYSAPAGPSVAQSSPSLISLEESKMDTHDGTVSTVMLQPPAQASLGKHLNMPNKPGSNVPAAPIVCTDSIVNADAHAGHSEECSDMESTVTAPPRLPAKPDAMNLSGRQRSISLPEKDGSISKENFFDAFSPKIGSDPRRALSLHDIAPEGKSALSANKQLYRSHRQMRIAVLEASRRFEEQQLCRARDALMAQKEAESAIHGAGLVMRHGHRAQVTTDAIRDYLHNRQRHQQQLVDKSNRRGGRGRSARKKTVSDMSAMMSGSMGQDELALITAHAGAMQNDDKSMFNQSVSNIGLPELTEGKVAEAPPMPVLKSQKTAPEVRVLDRPDIRKATVPGDFRKTQDPFSTTGLYGPLRLASGTSLIETPSDLKK